MVDDARAFFAGRLLVAAPQIEEETFRRSVVLLLHHDEDGAQGVILNRPIEADIEAVLPGWKTVASTPQTMFQGGPVELNSAIGLVTVPGDEPEPLGVKHLFGGLGLVDLDAPPNLVAPEVAGMRIFAGYAGMVRWAARERDHPRRLVRRRQRVARRLLDGAGAAVVRRAAAPERQPQARRQLPG